MFYQCSHSFNPKFGGVQLIVNEWYTLILFQYHCSNTTGHFPQQLNELRHWSGLTKVGRMTEDRPHQSYKAGRTTGIKVRTFPQNKKCQRTDRWHLILIIGRLFISLSGKLYHLALAQCNPTIHLLCNFQVMGCQQGRHTRRTHQCGQCLKHILRGVWIEVSGWLISQ